MDGKNHGPLVTRSLKLQKVPCWSSDAYVTVLKRVRNNLPKDSQFLSSGKEDPMDGVLGLRYQQG